jgi:hypothetical protein
MVGKWEVMVRSGLLGNFRIARDPGTIAQLIGMDTTSQFIPFLNLINRKLIKTVFYQSRDAQQRSNYFPLRCPVDGRSS